MIWLGIPAWGWIGLALVLIALEMLVAPGSYLVWVGLAALVMGGLTALIAFDWAVELVVFALLSLGISLIGWRFYGSRSKFGEEARALNDIGEAMVGREIVLAAPIAAGFGQARVDDSFWRVAGPELPVGARVRVVAIDGATLIVEALP